MHEWARKRIKERISTLQVDLQEPVHAAIRRRYPEVGLTPYGQVVTDCFRLPRPERTAPPASLEKNISTLIEMGLANRERALFVLEATQNDIEEAVLLLMANSTPPQHRD